MGNLTISQILLAALLGGILGIFLVSEALAGVEVLVKSKSLSRIDKAILIQNAEAEQRARSLFYARKGIKINNLAYHKADFKVKLRPVK